MKRLLLVSLCLTGFMANAMQQQEQRSPLRQQLDAERKAFLQLQQPLLGDAAAASASDARLVTVESMAVAGGGASPARPVVAAQTVSPDDAFQDVLSESDIQDLFRREPALKKLTEAQQELFASKFQQIMTVVREMLEADQEKNQERKLSTKKRIIASAAELGILTPVMMIYTYFLGESNRSTAPIFHHYTAQSWLRNFRDFNSIVKIILGGAAIGIGHVVDYHLFANPVGLTQAAQFYTVGTILHALADINNIKATRETICGTCRRVMGWIKSKRNTSV